MMPCCSARDSRDCSPRRSSSWWAAANADELLAIVRDAPSSRRPHVAVVDIRMPPTHTTEGLVAAETIRAEHPEIGVLVLSQYIETEHAMDLLGDGAGGTGYLLKDRISTSRGSETRCNGWATAVPRSTPK